MSQENESTPPQQIPEMGQPEGDNHANKITLPVTEYINPYATLEKEPDIEVGSENTVHDELESEPDNGLNFIGHLDEIRSRLLISVVVLLVVVELVVVVVVGLVSSLNLAT